MERGMVVIGGSAGAMEALCQIVADLPPDFGAPIFVTIHFPSSAVSTLPAILRRHGSLTASHAVDRDPIRSGMIYVAPPDRHLLVEAGFVRVTRGPRENGHRPAIDPLFRSAARIFGPRVIAVLLSGNLDDGTAGLLAVRSLGGRTIVQDPSDARYGGMPSSAIENGAADHVVERGEIGALLARLLDDLPEHAMPEVPSDMSLETGMAEFDAAAFSEDQRPGTPSGFSCPECHGVLFEIDEVGLVRYRCRVGHAYGSDTLLAHQTDSVEAALWTALKALKERAALTRKLARRMASRGNQRTATSFEEQAADNDRMAETIAEVLRSGAYRGRPTPADSSAAD
jgi:two-component system, chemotaxis family, protein-glutamate methylesterase/glutaminase